MSDEGEREGGFLSGWSRRKLQAKQQETAVLVDPAPAVPDADVPETPADDPDLIAALPSLDDITAGFDMKPFLARGVPAHLKNAALRKLWLVSPLVRDYADPAVDYAWDWNAPGGVPGGGGVLSEQSVAKMVKDLIGKPAKTDEAMANAETPPDPEGDPTEPATAAVTSKETPPPAAVRRSDPTKNLNPAPDPQTGDKVPAEKQVAGLTQRRHGGAVPQ